MVAMNLRIDPFYAVRMLAGQFMVLRFWHSLGFLAICFGVYGYCNWVPGHVNLLWALILLPGHVLLDYGHFS